MKPYKIRPASLMFVMLGALIAIFLPPLVCLFSAAYHKETLSYIPFIPIISAYFFYVERKKLNFSSQLFTPPALLILFFGLLLYAISYIIADSLIKKEDILTVQMASLYLCIIGSYIFCFGVRRFLAARFPLLFLAFIIPIPSLVLEAIIGMLQRFSTHAADLIFAAFGIEYIRDGHTFYLPNITIVVAHECSGIRSSISLFITAVLSGRIFLRQFWSRIILILITFPIAVLKNALRISVLSFLGIYVNKSFLSGPLHHRGGMLFFLISLLLLGAVIIILKKAEKLKLKR